MYDLKRIRFAYFPAEAEIPVIAWYLKQLDLRLTEAGACLSINDIKFGRAGLEISWDLTGIDSEELESVLEAEIDWVCRRVTGEQK